MLHLSGRLGGFLQYGTKSFDTGDRLDFKSASTFIKHAPRQMIPKSMCGWAFELIKTDRVSAVLDLQLLCQRYAAFSRELKIESRCLVSNFDTIQCDGSSPHACERFTRMKVEDQSAHAPNLSWEMHSYALSSGV